MPYAGKCGQCTYFVWGNSESLLRWRLNEHRKEKGHTKKHYEVWWIHKDVKAQYDRDCHDFDWHWRVCNEIIRNIPPSPQAHRHRNSLTISPAKSGQVELVISKL